MNSSTLFDNHGRPISYLRLSVTDRCNLRCFYCMPEKGIQYLPRTELLSYEEMLRLIRILAGLGVSKVRITGGEPFVRRDLIQFLEKLSEIQGIEAINLTTNGVLTAEHIPALKAIGISTVNLSLDTLDRNRFHEITRRDLLPEVMKTYEQLLSAGIKVKVNAVVMEGKNTIDIPAMAELAESNPVEVRFIEEMPFNGEGSHYQQLAWTHRQIHQVLGEIYPDLHELPAPPHSTARIYSSSRLIGKLGIIPAFSRTFCGDCNRIRITAQGTLKTCLYDEGVLDLKALLRSGKSDSEMEDSFKLVFNQRFKDGHEAEAARGKQSPVKESMSAIGG